MIPQIKMFCDPFPHPSLFFGIWHFLCPSPSPGHSIIQVLDLLIFFPSVFCFAFSLYILKLSLTLYSNPSIKYFSLSYFEEFCYILSFLCCKHLVLS